MSKRQKKKIKSYGKIEQERKKKLSNVVEDDDDDDEPKTEFTGDMFYFNHPYGICK